MRIFARQRVTQNEPVGALKNDELPAFRIRWGYVMSFPIWNKFLHYWLSCPNDWLESQLCHYLLIRHRYLREQYNCSPCFTNKYWTPNFQDLLRYDSVSAVSWVIWVLTRSRRQVQWSICALPIYSKIHEACLLETNSWSELQRLNWSVLSPSIRGDKLNQSAKLRYILLDESRIPILFHADSTNFIINSLVYQSPLPFLFIYLHVNVEVRFFRC